ncbi:MAG: ABC transporter permease, partial [Actinomycetota bacterium]|nr:ABC transporter permease [Actinomycetota bacterium]
MTTTTPTTTSSASEPSSSGSSPDGPGGLAGLLGGIADRAAVLGVAVPVLSVLGALLVGAVLIIAEGENPLAVYTEAVQGVLTGSRGLSNTATVATPLILIGLGYAVAYRAKVFTIGGEGQYLIGAVAGTAWVTAAGVRDLPGPVLVVTGLVVAVVAGALWSALAGWLGVRFGANIVISSLMLVYIADSVLQWAVREGIRDPDAFIPSSRPIGDAALGELPGTHTHLGFALAVLACPLAAWLLARHRSGYRISALGHNAAALDANEVRSSRIVLLVMVVAGALAGLAGFTETAGVNTSLGAEASVGYGWEAVIVALLGRLHPIGVLAAGLGLAGMTIG